MEYNFLASMLIILVYLPITIYSIFSQTWTEKFMKVHSTTNKQFLLEILAGTIYAAIIFIALIRPFSQGTVFILGAVIYFCATIITFNGYYIFFVTPKQKLVTAFPYSFSRNPTYFFGLIAISGVAILTQNVFIFVLVLIQWAITDRIIVVEEAYCEKKYKQTFLRYKRHVPRYI